MRHGRMLRIALCAVFAFSLSAIGDEDDDEKAAASDQQAASPGLNEEQQRAVGIVVAHPLVAKAAERIEAFGLVLDATLLISDLGERSAAAAARAFGIGRIRAIARAIRGPAPVHRSRCSKRRRPSRRERRRQVETARARFALHWGPMAALSMSRRAKASSTRRASGHSLLLRADLAGRHSVGAIAGESPVGCRRHPGSRDACLEHCARPASCRAPVCLVEVPNAPSGLRAGRARTGGLADAGALRAAAAARRIAV
jgi:hypothetical protein